MYTEIVLKNNKQKDASRNNYRIRIDEVRRQSLSISTTCHNDDLGLMSVYRSEDRAGNVRAKVESRRNILGPSVTRSKRLHHP